MKKYTPLRHFLGLSVLCIGLVSAFVIPKGVFAATGTFKVSDYGTGQTSSMTSAYYRGYVFQVSQEVVIDHLIGGGGSSPYGVGIYSVTVNSGGSSVTANALLGKAVTSASGANQILTVTSGNSGGGSTITLEPGTNYLLASGRGASGSGNHWVVTSLNVANIVATPLIDSWGPTSGGYTYRWNNVTGDPTAIVGQTSTDIQGTTLPMLGFSYSTSAASSSVTTVAATFNGSSASFKGQVTNTGGADTARYIEWGHQSNMSDGTLQSIGTLSATGTVPNDFLYSTTSVATGTYYYRAVGINVVGRTDGSILGPYTAYSFKYTAGANGSLTGTTTQAIWGGQNGTAVTAVPNTNYHFTQWSDGSTQNPRTDISASSTIDVTASFALGIQYYDISFDTQGGSPVGTFAGIAEGSTTTLPAASARDGYIFQNWNTSSNGTGTSYAPGATYTVPSGDVTLYAIWQLQDTTPPVISSITANSIVSTGAVIDWSTDEDASTRVIYSVDQGYASSTGESNTNPRVKSHEASLGGLIACTTYNYKVISADASNNYATSSSGVFTTDGCIASPVALNSSVVSVASQSTTTLSSGGNSIVVSVPQNVTATSSSIVIQIKGLSSNAVLGSIGKPSDSYSSAASVVFDVTALVDNTTVLDSFDLPVTISYTYTDSDVSGIDESSLKMYHYHDGSWLPLDNCSVDTTANVITCTTPSFSTFAIFGTALPTASTAANMGASSFGGGGGGSVQEQYRQLLAMGAATQASALKAQYPYLFTDASASVQTSATPAVRDLQIGMTGSDVMTLQKFLNSIGFVLAASGPGSPGNETSKFASLTKAAVSRYQKANGISPAAGYFGPLTRANMKSKGLSGIWW